jgi:hypothetical protein
MKPQEEKVGSRIASSLKGHIRAHIPTKPNLILGCAIDFSQTLEKIFPKYFFRIVLFTVVVPVSSYG